MNLLRSGPTGAMTLRRIPAIVLCALTVTTGLAAGQTRDLTTLSLEDLLNVEITSISGKEQTIGRTAAAVYVITAQDIERSGATTLPDLFRMVPGFSVAQLNANTWSVTSRGFGGTHANKLLVLIDGRSIYTPLNGGVNWEMQLLPLEAIEQIEVIRGPGGSLWGTNAINGVINIITKSADRTDGGALSTHVGRYEPGTVDFSYGGSVGSSGRYATYARYFQRSAPGLTEGHRNGDDIEAAYSRTRIDWATGTDRFSIQGDLQRSAGERVESVLLLSPPFHLAAPASASSTAGTGVFSWTRSDSARDERSLRFDYSGLTRSELSEEAHTFNVDARRRRLVGSRNDFAIGAEYRFTTGTVLGEPTLTISPAHVHQHLLTAFVQDDIAISQGILLTPGVKVERNQDTGFELQPSVRALWEMSSRHSVWGAASRAVRTPNRFERGMHIAASASQGPGGVPLVVTIQGSPWTSSEILTEYEAGYRAHSGAYSLDLTGFVGSYDHLASLSQGTPGFGEELGTRVFRVPLTARNDALATSRGVEVAASWKPIAWGQISANYTLFDIAFGSQSASGGSAQAVPINGPTPEHLFHARAFVDLPGGLDASALFYRGSPIPAIAIDAVDRLDLRLAWSAHRRLRVAVGVQNLFHVNSAEYADRTSRTAPSPVRTGPYSEVSWRF